MGGSQIAGPSDHPVGNVSFTHEDIGYPPPVGGLLGATYDYDDDDQTVLKRAWRWLARTKNSQSLHNT